MGLRVSGSVVSLTGSPLGQIGLMPLPLSVRQVVPLVVVQRQTQLTLVAATKKPTLETLISLTRRREG